MQHNFRLEEELTTINGPSGPVSVVGQKRFDAIWAALTTPRRRVLGVSVLRKTVYLIQAL